MTFSELLMRIFSIFYFKIMVFIVLKNSMSYVFVSFTRTNHFLFGGNNVKADQVKFYRNDNNIELIYCENSSISYSTHTHITNYTLGLVIEGKINIVQNQHTNTCTLGDFFIIPPDIPHSISPESETYSLLSICLKKDYIYKNDINFISSHIKFLLECLAKDNSIFTNQISMLNDVTRAMLLDVINSEASDTDEIFHARLLLESMPENPVSIQKLSEQVFISPYHLIRSFKKQIGLTPHKFQMQNRIRKAQQILLKSKSITEVALTTGFCDQSHFNKWFHKIVGLTPTEYIEAQGTLSD